jgi:iron(II)-dependent oxidoreductase
MRLLDSALERWWRLGEVAPRSLLREGLLVLEAGHELGEAQRTLLLRSALVHGTGQITALHHQTDMERVALVMQEAALTWEPPLPAAAVAWLADHDPRGQRWLAPLIHDLRMPAAAAAGVQRERAEALLAALEHGPMEGDVHVRTAEPVGPGAGAWAERSRWWMVAALALVVVGLIWWQVAVHRPRGMVEAPPGSYMVRDPALDGVERRVRLDGFLIDRLEVTNREYRRCYEGGACPWPSSVHSATRPNYFLERGFADYPVVNVSQAGAAAYCQWAGKRLPTAEEWEVAAGYAPATNRQYRYPWGEPFEAQRANSALSNLGDTLAAGHYRPAGDSPVGASEMAGNVAEWTSTQVQQGEQSGYVVKGGSFQDVPGALSTSAQVVLAGEHGQAWVGLRCTRTVLLDR